MGFLSSTINHPLSSTIKLIFYINSQVFDSTAFRYSLYGVVGAIKAVSTTVQVILYKTIKKSEKKDEAIKREEKSALMSNGNGYHVGVPSNKEPTETVIWSTDCLEKIITVCHFIEQCQYRLLIASQKDEG